MGLKPGASYELRVSYPATVSVPVGSFAPLQFCGQHAHAVEVVCICIALAFPQTPAKVQLLLLLLAATPGSSLDSSSSDRGRSVGRRSMRKDAFMQVSLRCHLAMHAYTPCASCVSKAEIVAKTRAKWLACKESLRMFWCCMVLRGAASCAGGGCSTRRRLSLAREATGPFRCEPRDPCSIVPCGSQYD